MDLLCRLFGHTRDRNHAWHDDLEWRAPCARCGTPLIRDERIARWRPFSAEDHNSLRRERPTRG